MFKRVAEHCDQIKLIETATRHFEHGSFHEALLLFAQLSQMGYGLAQLNTGWLIEKDYCTFCDGDKSYEHSYKFYLDAAMQEESEGLRAIGDYNFYGHVPGEPPNASAAFGYYDAAVEAQPNNPLALYSLGYMYEHGKGNIENITLARELYANASKIPSELTLAIKFSYYNMYLKEYGLDVIGSLCDSFPSLCEFWHSQMEKSDAFSRHYSSVDWEAITQSQNFMIELGKSLLIAIMLTLVIPKLAYIEVGGYDAAVEAMQRRNVDKLGLDSPHACPKQDDPMSPRIDESKDQLPGFMKRISSAERFRHRSRTSGSRSPSPRGSRSGSPRSVPRKISYRGKRS